MKTGKKIFGLIILFIGPVLLALALSYLVAGRPLWELDAARLTEYYRGLGIWAVVISLGLNILQTFVVFMPSVFLSGANALVFGLFWGTLVSWLGEVIGAVIAFGIYRCLGRGSVEELEKSRGYLQKIDELSSRRGFGIVLILRVLPAMPSGIINLLAALSKISFAAFITATAIGKLPSLVLESFIGHDLFAWRENLARLLILAALAMLGYLAYYFYRKMSK